MGLAMAAAENKGTGRAATERPGGSNAAGVLDPGATQGHRARSAADSVGEGVASESARPVSPPPRLSPELPLSPGLKEKVLEAVRNVKPEAGGDPGRKRSPSRKATGVRDWLPWICAAAAGFALAFSMENLRRLDREVAVHQAGLVELAGQVRDLQARLDREGGASSFLDDPGVRALLLLGTPKSPEARGAVFWNGQQRKARLYTSRLPQLSREKTYQLWLIADKPVGAGTFRVNPAGQGYLEVVDLDGAAPPIEIAVSMEPAGGAPRLTGDVYLAGAF